MEPTLAQTKKLIEVTDKAGLSKDDMQFLLEEGLYTDLVRYAGNHALRARRDSKKIRIEIQKLLGLSALFATPAEQLQMFIRINREHRLGFSNDSLRLLATPTEETSGLVVWTLEATLDTPAETFDTVRYLMGMESSCEIIGVYDETNWKPRSIRWVKIDLGADLGVRPGLGRNSQSAHIGPMWQAIYSPNWFKSLGGRFDGMDIPEVSLPGFSINYGKVGGVPHLEPSRIRQHALDHSYTNSGKGQAALARYVF